MASQVEAAVAAPASEAVSTAPTAAFPPPNREKLLRQLEYYFSDVAFPFDDFLKGQADAKSMVPALVLAGSPKVVSMTPELTPEARATLLLELTQLSDSIAASECGERIGRIHPLPSEDPKVRCFSVPRRPALFGLSSLTRARWYPLND